MKNICPFFFMQLDPSVDGQGGFNIVEENAVRGIHRNVYYYEHRLPKKRKRSCPSTEDNDNTPLDQYEVVKLPFVTKWLQDPKILTIAKICCDPSRPHGLLPIAQDSVAYNTWPGFKAARLPPVPESVEQEAMARFYAHVLKCVQEEAVALYMMDYFANIFQRPYAKTKVAILLQGVQGCGKGAIFDTIRAVMGEMVAFQTGDPAQDLFSRFSTGFKNKVLVQVCTLIGLAVQN